MEDGTIRVRVLVVDDNEVNAFVLMNMLNGFGVSADHAECGRQAVAMAKKQAYHIIFIDHIMPDMNGMETAAELRSLFHDPSETVMIALTSVITDEIRLLYQQSGVNFVFEKPLELAQLDGIMRQNFPLITMQRKRTPDDSQILCRNDQPFYEMFGDVEEISKTPSRRQISRNGYLNILEISLKDMKRITNYMKFNINNQTLEAIPGAIHNLIGVFSHINAKDLAEEARAIEKATLHMDIQDVQLTYSRFLDRIRCFQQKLNQSVEKYYENQKMNEEDSRENILPPMSERECEQSIINTIYYIRRFEYDSVVQELKRLVERGQKEFKQDFEASLMELKEFNYEKVLCRMLDIKNKIGI